MPLRSFPVELPKENKIEGHTWNFRITFFSGKDIKAFLFTLEMMVNPMESLWAINR